MRFQGRSLSTSRIYIHTRGLPLLSGSRLTSSSFVLLLLFFLYLREFAYILPVQKNFAPLYPPRLNSKRYPRADKPARLRSRYILTAKLVLPEAIYKVYTQGVHGACAYYNIYARAHARWRTTVAARSKACCRLIQRRYCSFNKGGARARAQTELAKDSSVGGGCMCI